MALQTRINSIDFLRGLVMIIMALDHTRDFFHIESLTGDPLDLHTTTPLLFFTRWITHFCAPVFVFLSGTSAFLQGLRKPKKELSSFLMKRGLWLIFVELVIMTLGITFDLQYNYFILQVIWAIGISMVLLSLIIWLPFRAILAIGLIILATHNLLDYYEAGHQGNYTLWYQLLHKQGIYPLSADHSLFIFYPFLAWTGVMILGYCFGKFYMHDVMNRHKRTMILGVALVIFFICVRLADVYGDPLHWSVQDTSLHTLFSFINTQKYPPSLLYTCMTIGPALILLGALGDATNKFIRFVTVYGRVPLFYYILHFYLLHLISAIMFIARGHTFAEGAKGIEQVPFKFQVPGEGYGLSVVYLVWLCVVLALYPLCRWYSNYKLVHKRWWVSYI
jgi:uncharacterized membrane protein